MAAISGIAEAQIWSPTYTWRETTTHVVAYDHSENCTSTSSGFPHALETRNDGNGFGYYMASGTNTRENQGTLNVDYILKDGISLTSGTKYALQFNLQNVWNWIYCSNAKLSVSLVESTEEETNEIQSIGEIDIYKDYTSGTILTIPFTYNGSADVAYFRLTMTGTLIDYGYILDLYDFKVYVDEPNDITIETVTGGSISADKSTARVLETVTLTPNPDDGYVISAINVVETESGKSVAVDGCNFENPTSGSFVMPAVPVTVTPIFGTSVSAKDGAYIYMPTTETKSMTLSTAIHSFKLYDDGGVDGKYSSNCNGYLALTAPEGKQIRITGTVTTEGGNYDWLDVYDGLTTSVILAENVHSNSSNVAITITPIVSSGNTILIHFRSDSSSEYAGLNLVVSVVDAPTVVAPNAIENLTYNAAAQALVTEGSTNFGTLVYSLDGTNYSEDIPTATNADTYTVYYKVEAGETWLGVDAESVEVTIAKADPTYTAPAAQTIACNQTLSDITLPEGFSFENAETEIALGKTKTVTLTYTPSNTENYNVVTDIALNVTKSNHIAATAVVEDKVDPTCTETGSHNDVVYCSVCNAKLSTTPKVDPAIGHDWGEWETVTASTCVTKGSQKRVCSHDASHVETEELPLDANNHANVVIDAAVDATCTESGLTEGSHCEACHVVLVAQETIAVLQHSFTHYEYNNDATTENDGTETATCDYGCGTTDTRTKIGTMLPGTVTRVDKVNTDTVESDVWFDFSGRRLNGKPTTPGLYIHNGKKALVK